MTDMFNNILGRMLNDIDLPVEVKIKVRERYEDLGKWLNREDSTVAKYHPYIFPQGSFLLQTAIRPISKKGEYDLDIGCKFMRGLSSNNIEQKALKTMLRRELESYRKARNIEAELEEKKRCWRLEYKDAMSFHIDVVPCIPVREFDDLLYGSFYENIYEEQDLILSPDNVEAWSSLSALITDNESFCYNAISEKWNHSNPEGFGKWFRAHCALPYTKEAKDASSGQAKIADLPVSEDHENAVLRKIIKLLKRHRDVMYKEESDYKPISIIISKLAADAYDGEKDLGVAILHVIKGMRQALDAITTKILNPTEPMENYADKWDDDEAYRTNFKTWLVQAKVDFSTLSKSDLTSEEAERIIVDRFKLTYHEGYKKLFPYQQPVQGTRPSPFNIASAKYKPWAE